MDNFRSGLAPVERAFRLRSALFIFFLALLPRLVSLGADLPRVYFPDEPHHLNLAAHYATGDLNPHDFKYPTFWTYWLAVLLGGMYAVFRILGLIGSAAQYAVLFVNQPTVFYLAARLLACAFFAGAAALLAYDFSPGSRSRIGRNAGLILALSPSLASYGREATPYCLLVACVAGVIVFSERLLRGITLRDAVLAGAFTGGAASSHYLGATIASLPALAILLGASRSAKIRASLGFVLGAIFLFAATSPFVLLDWKSAATDIFSIGTLQTPTGAEGIFSLSRTWDIFKNALMFFDPWAIGFFLALIGAGLAPRSERLHRWIWFGPFVILLPLLLVSHYGALPRYALAVLIPLAVPAAYGLDVLLGRLASPITKWGIGLSFFAVFAGGALVPGLRAARPDTRTQAEAWVRDHISPGQKIFVTDPFHCPQLPMARAQLLRLRDRCAAISHPRARYYDLLLAGGVGNGYEIYQLRRSSTETADIPRRDDYAYQAIDWLDPRQDGFAVLRKAGIDVVILDSGVNPAAHPWISELRASAALAARFDPEKNHERGPTIEIYKLSAAGQSS